MQRNAGIHTASILAFWPLRRLRLLRTFLRSLRAALRSTDSWLQRWTRCSQQAT